MANLNNTETSVFEDFDASGETDFADDVDISADDESTISDIEEIDDAFLNEIDLIDADDAPEADSDDDLLLAPGNAANTSSVADSGQKDNATNQADADKKDAETSETDQATAKTDDSADAEKLTEEEEKYINSLPPKEREQARRWHKNSRMQTTFLDTKVPADQWRDNLKAKSEMRYGEVARSIIKDKSADPLNLLNDIYDATKDEEGFSETYARLLEQAYETNPEYFNGIIEAKGLKVVAADAPDTATSKSETPDISTATAEEITEIEDSFLFQQLAESDPDLAEKLLNGLKSADQLQLQLAAKTDAPAQTPEQIQAAEQKRVAEEGEQHARVQVFESAYDENITSYVAQKLKTDYRLEVSPEEREKQPTMAFLKESKALAVQFGIGSLPDFDEGLKEWAKDKPGFKEAVDGAITYAKAKEKANAANALKGAQEYASLYLQERLKSPEIKMIDEIMQIVARSQRAALRTRTETVPQGFGKTRQSSGSDNLLQEIDDLD